MKRPTDIDGLVADNIRALRLHRGLSQGAMATKLGVTFQQFQKYEKGHNRISAGRLLRIANILRVEVQALYTGAKTATPAGRAQSPVRLIRRKDAMQLVQAFDGIEDKSIRLGIVALVENIATRKR
jgi:transcriptional regulator with XRE-family HTH domain